VQLCDRFIGDVSRGKLIKPIKFQKEALNGDNSIMTDNYGLQAVYKYHVLKKLPPILIIHLKRYQYNIVSGRFEKINDRYAYEE
jgi:hypothetical protein